MSSYVNRFKLFGNGELVRIEFAEVRFGTDTEEPRESVVMTIDDAQSLIEALGKVAQRPKGH